MICNINDLFYILMLFFFALGQDLLITHHRDRGVHEFKTEFKCRIEFQLTPTLELIVHSKHRLRLGKKTALQNTVFKCPLFLSLFVQQNIPRFFVLTDLTTSDWILLHRFRQSEASQRILTRRITIPVPIHITLVRDKIAEWPVSRWNIIQGWRISSKIVVDYGSKTGQSSLIFSFLEMQILISVTLAALRKAKRNRRSTAYDTYVLKP